MTTSKSPGRGVTFADLVGAAAEKYPRHGAIRCDGRTITYRQLQSEVNRLTSWLTEIGAAGQRVASLAPNDATTVASYLAMAQAGATAVPLNTRLLPGELAYMLQDADVRFLVADPEHAELAGSAIDEAGGDIALHLYGWQGTGAAVPFVQARFDAGQRGAPLRRPEPPAAANILYTSGTTGRPKGILRGHAPTMWSCLNPALGFPRTASDVEYFTMPIFGVVFFHFVVPALMAGATVLLDRRFDPERTLRRIEAERATIAFLAPTMIDALLEAAGERPAEMSSLRALLTAFHFPPKVRERALDFFAGRIAFMYGQSEAQPTVSEVGSLASDPACVGRPMGFARVWIEDEDREELPPGAEGQIVMDTPAAMDAYHRQPELTAATVQGSRVHTGDRGRMDELGNLYFVNRESEFIKSGGFRIDPVEVENVIVDHASVREAAVVGVPDDRWGEMTVAFVTLHGPALDRDEVIKFCRGRIAGYKVPKAIVVLKNLPRTALGKVERRALRRFWAELTDASRSTANG
jgi:acyl-CoA synthetase (AMP-forming)/AMP-acid ligase II